MAYDYGVAGIVLSNHGGRQLDTSRSGIENLIEVIEALKTRGPWPNPKFEVFVDGGIRRASDVLKAIALGAKAVGVGRSFLYSFCAYGEAGVEKAIQIFRVRTNESSVAMDVIGCSCLRCDDLGLCHIVSRVVPLKLVVFRTNFKWACASSVPAPSMN